jgi:hypothetical protein
MQVAGIRPVAETSSRLGKSLYASSGREHAEPPPDAAGGSAFCLRILALGSSDTDGCVRYLGVSANGCLVFRPSTEDAWDGPPCDAFLTEAALSVLGSVLVGLRDAGACADRHT